MHKIIELRRAHAEKVKACRELISLADTEKRNLTDEEKQHFEDLEREIDSLSDQIVREERQLQREANLPKQPDPVRNLLEAPGVITGGIKEDLEPGVRLARYVKSVLNARLIGEAPEAAAQRMYPKDNVLHESFRSLSTQTPSEGGALVPENLSDEIIPLLRDISDPRALGARSVPLGNGNLTIPRQTGGANFQWVGENEKITSSKPTLGAIRLSAKKLAGLIPISNEMIRYSGIAADRWVRDELVNGIAEKEGTTAIYGTGTEYTPIGVKNAPGVNKSALNKIPNSDDLANIVGQLVSQKFGALIRPGWVIPGVLWSILYNLKDGLGNYIHRKELDEGKLISFPYKINNNIIYNSAAPNADTEIYFGDWDKFLIGEDMAIEVKASEEATYWDGSQLVSAYTNDQTVMRAITRQDFGVRYGSAFVVRTGVWTK